MAFNYYRSVTTTHAQVPSTQTNFPVYVTMTLNAGHVSNSNGYDIRPYSDTGASSALTYQLESYDNGTGIVHMWVLIASLSASVDNVFYLHYGNGALTTDGSSTSTWDSHYKMIWHLPNGTSLTANDATSNAVNGTVSGAVAVAGKTGGAASFDGSNDVITLSGPALNITDFTFSFWIYPIASSDNYATLLTSNGAGGVFYRGGSLKISYYDSADNLNTTALTEGAWNYIAITCDYVGTDLRFYLNGAADGSNLSFVASPLTVTKCGDDDSSETFKGYLDELRISDSLRSANWITAEYNNQSNPGSFLTVGSEVNVGGGSASKAIRSGVLGMERGLSRKILK